MNDGFVGRWDSNSLKLFPLEITSCKPIPITKKANPSSPCLSFTFCYSKVTSQELYRRDIPNMNEKLFCWFLDKNTPLIGIFCNLLLILIIIHGGLIFDAGS